MKKDLIETLKQLHTIRLTNYNQTAYQRKSSDSFFENVPDELKELWYGHDVVSFVTLSIDYYSKLDLMSRRELMCLINNEHCLITRLKKIFSNLETQKGFKTYEN